MSRPTSQHRLSFGASSIPVRNTYNRSHSHTVSSGSINANGRIGRRKSSTFGTGVNAAAIGAALESAVADGSVAATSSRTPASKAALAALNGATYPAMPSSLPYHASVPEDMGSAVIDGPALSTFQGVDKAKLKMRRASDGTRLTKKEKTVNGELKCDQCGKSYKHGSCLNKHLWEHTPEWQYTSKLLISKHQQVQLLEAASVLLAMNTEGTSAVPNDSDNSSSPAASGSSEREDDLSSAETTPPPQADNAYRDSSKRYSNTSDGYSRSYQSVFSSSAPNDHGFSHHRHWSSSSNRPHTAHTPIADEYRDEDPADLAAAVGLLSCSYGTPTSRPLRMPSDIPPVPPLPEKYASYQRTDDVIMDDDESSDGDDNHRRASRHEDEVGMFGAMDA